MDGHRIQHFLSMDPYTNRYFKGIVMQDYEELPEADTISRENPGLYILNTDRRGGKGKHWCAAFLSENAQNKRVGDFFDPYGFDPLFYGFRHFFTLPTCEYLVQSAKQVQGIFSKACGFHCLFFAYHRCRGVPLMQILQYYDDRDMHKNEKLVMDFVLQFGREYKTW